MIVVAGTAKIQAEKIEAARAAAAAMSTASEAEPGCISYKFYASIADPTTFFIFEEWENDAALKAHFETPHMATFREALADVLAGEMKIYRYEVAKKQGL